MRKTLNTNESLNRFLASVEGRAFSIAVAACRNRADALDCVQEAMTALVKRYRNKDSEEWPPLFYRILSNKIRDLQRRNSLRNRFAAFLPAADEDGPQIEELLVEEQTPERTLEVQEQLQQVAKAMENLPKRQHQVFVMRILEELSVQQCAKALGVTEGSIKTHLSRAMQTIRLQLGVQELEVGNSYE